MSKQQKNSAFVKMLKEFPKVFGRVSFRERLMLRTAFDYINEEVIADIKANCDLAIEGRDVKIKELEADNRLLEQRGSDILKELLDKNKRCIELEKENANLEKKVNENDNEDYNTRGFLFIETPGKTTVEIGRYFADKGHEMVEITHEEYLKRLEHKKEKQDERN